MKIHVNINEPYLFETKSNISFAIYWEHNNTFYPEKNWVDFGTVITGFWTNTIMELIEQNYKKSVFNFMDGPYRIQAQYDHLLKLVSLHPERTDITWKISIDVIIRELISVIERIGVELEAKNKLNRYKDDLESLTPILNRCLSKVEKG